MSNPMELARLREDLERSEKVREILCNTAESANNRVNDLLSRIERLETEKAKWYADACEYAERNNVLREAIEAHNKKVQTLMDRNDSVFDIHSRWLIRVPRYCPDPLSGAAEAAERGLEDK